MNTLGLVLAAVSNEKLATTINHPIVLALLLTLALLLVALLSVRLTLQRSVKQMTEWMKGVRTGSSPESLKIPNNAILAPLVKEASTLAQNLSQAEAAAKQEARLRQIADSVWTRERLREHVRTKLQDRSLILIANREPYRHVHKGSAIDCVMPASGLVTGVEPILRACGGTWIACGDGDADRETSDSDGRLKVPPESPSYTLRRVWLTPEEEKGFYLGFSNEGLWPLCHIAHTRPIFRPDDWAFYQEVNRKFADAALEEIRDLQEPWLLIQDYHFTLLPRLIKEKRPDARIALFWHIPWPNPEAFGICPWQETLLDGMLGADLIGFHTQFHCNNFLETVDRTLESRIDREHFAVARGDHLTTVKPFPISVDFPEPPAGSAPANNMADREKIFKAYWVKAKYMGVGVDRIDYTKGILERLKGVERFLEKYPLYQGQFTFFQIGAPSRTDIPRYRDFVEEVKAEAERINSRFKAKGNKTIVLLARHHSHEEIRPFYRAADVCLVTSLHDGMNLVAKEFVAARQDESGVLILSCFTGASRELHDAIIVNPYDVDQVADAIRSAIEMEDSEKTLRMVRLRAVVRENNIYRWAANLVTELSTIRLKSAIPA